MSSGSFAFTRTAFLTRTAEPAARQHDQHAIAPFGGFVCLQPCSDADEQNDLGQSVLRDAARRTTLILRLAETLTQSFILNLALAVARNHEGGVKMRVTERVRATRGRG